MWLVDQAASSLDELPDVMVVIGILAVVGLTAPLGRGIAHIAYAHAGESHSGTKIEKNLVDAEATLSLDSMSVAGGMAPSQSCSTKAVQVSDVARSTGGRSRNAHQGAWRVSWTHPNCSKEKNKGIAFDGLSVGTS